MKRFATLLEALVFCPSRNGKIRLLCDYLAHEPDPHRGWALAALTGELSLKTAKPAMIRELVARRTDPVLFGLSYDFVGDLAETAALIWQRRPGANRPPEVGEVIEILQDAPRSAVPGLMEVWLDACDASERLALLKLVTGGLRVGVSGRLGRVALGQWGGIDVAEIEEVWHGLEPPWQALFAWGEGRAEKPDISAMPVFRPLMLAHPLEDEQVAEIDPAAFQVEWKWDGIRVQAVSRGDEQRLYSRTGDDIGPAFPDITEALAAVPGDFILDGELLVLRDGVVAPFNDLQQRLNRKRVTANMLKNFPAWIRAYDLLEDEAGDARDLAMTERRARLEAWYERHAPKRMDLSPVLGPATIEEMAALRANPPDVAIEGLMLKRKSSAYIAGRPKGHWFKWKRAPLTADCVLMYARRGHGKRSSFYSDYTFGCWRKGESGADELVPVGKAYSGFTDAELKWLDKLVRKTTINRFGPVREVEHGAREGLVLEIAFDSVHPSNRHKSGIAMRFPRIARIRRDKPAHEADRVETLERMIRI